MTFKLVLIALLLLLTTQPSMAQEAEIDPQTVKGIRDAVKELVRETNATTSGSIDNPKRSYLGQVSQLTGNQIGLDTRSGTMILTTTDQTTILNNKTKTKIPLASLKVGDQLLAMGYLTIPLNLDTRRLILVDNPKADNRQILTGKLTDISKEENLITLKNEKKNTVHTVELLSTLKLLENKNAKNVEAQISQLALGQALIMVVTPSLNNSSFFSASSILILPAPPLSPTPSPLSTP